MDYFSAVQQGRTRVKEAMEVLQDVAGPCYPMLFLKIGITEWTPVGPEMLFSLVPGKNGTTALVVCDADGNSKTMSTWLTGEKVAECARSLEAKGVRKFEGEAKLPV